MVQKNSIKPKLIAITGPTAIGKSDIAVKIARLFDGEIISADSMQVYKGMDIGTGKITPDEMQGIPHHMLDVVDSSVNYTVGQYVEDATKCINNVIQKNKLPIIVGGTGLYITSLLNGSDFGNADTNDEIRDKWKKILESEGKEFVYSHLKKIDPVSADKINVNDVKRVIRAIEIFEITGRPKSEAVSEVESPYDALVIVISSQDRELLYDKINRRVDKMFDSGLLDEVKRFMPDKNCNALQAIGYKEVVSFLDGEISFDEAKELVKKNSRNYAKRQMTYFRGMRVNKIFLEFDNNAEIIKNVKEFLQD